MVLVRAFFHLKWTPRMLLSDKTVSPAPGPGTEGDTAVDFSEGGTHLTAIIFLCTLSTSPKGICRALPTLPAISMSFPW